MNESELRQRAADYRIRAAQASLRAAAMRSATAESAFRVAAMTWMRLAQAREYEADTLADQAVTALPQERI